MKLFKCTRCHAVVFFENRSCGSCGALLGFDPLSQLMQAYVIDDSAGPATLDASAPVEAPESQPALPVWQPCGDPQTTTVTPCFNRIAYDVCNWMVDDAAQGWRLCRSCRLTRTVPNLSYPDNVQRWSKIETAKRRLIHALNELGLAPQPKRDMSMRSGDGTTTEESDLDPGLAFDMLLNGADGEKVLTGHANGVITIDLAETDDDKREALRVAMGEPMRTLLGHLRHEVSHYLQWCWIEPDPELIARCREVFGDDRNDYSVSLKQYYDNGAPADWQDRFISAYASSHPWEDWAETCAHWLLILAAVQTASSWGLSLGGPITAEPGSDDVSQVVSAHQLVLTEWLPVAQFLNSMNRSLGLADSYPFLMPSEVLRKLACVQSLLDEAALRHVRQAALNASTPTVAPMANETLKAAPPPA